MCTQFKSMSFHQGFPGAKPRKPCRKVMGAGSKAVTMRSEIKASLFTGTKEEELDSDDLEDEEDEDDDEDEEESQEQAGAETLGSLRRYMDEMDEELQPTDIAKSFTCNSKVSSPNS